MIKRSVILILTIFLLGFASASLSITEVSDIYNLGDKLYVSVNGLTGSESGNFNIDLVCDNLKVNLLKVSARAFSTSKEQSYSLPYKFLTKEDLEVNDIKNLSGSCFIVASLGSQSVSTKKFTISHELIISAKADKINYNPGELLILNAESTRADGGLFNGFYKIEGLGNFEGVVDNGIFQKSFNIETGKPAGDYLMKVSVYDLDYNKNALNEGSYELYIKVNSVATKITHSLSDLEIIPGNKLTIGVDIFDQTNVKMSGEVSVSLTAPNGEKSSYLVSSGGFLEIPFKTNAVAGKWEITSSLNDLNSEAEINILPLKKVSSSLEGSILIVENIGNVDYLDILDVKIGDEIQKINLNLKVGEIKKFTLEAPDGEYNVNVGDGEDSLTGSVFLTGNAISVKDLSVGGLLTTYYFVWIFLLAVLGGLAFILIKRYRRTKVMDGQHKLTSSFNSWVSSMKDKFTLGKESSGVSIASERNMVDMTKNKKISVAESSLILKGEKMNCAVVAMKIKNYNQLSGLAKDKLVAFMSEASGDKGVVEWKNDYGFVIFSPVITKTYTNEILAVEVAMRLLEVLREYNKKFSEKIDIGIGVHIGEFICGKEDGKLKYISVGNSMILPKRIAEMRTDKVLISEAIRRKVLRDLRTERVNGANETGIYSVSEIKNKEGNQERLKDLLKRMKN